MAGLSLDPRARLGLLLCASTLSICLDRPESLGLLTLCAVLPLLALRVERRWLGAGLAAALTLTWSTALSQGLFYDQEPRVALAQLGPLVLYREGLRHGLVQSLRLLSMTFGGLALSLRPAGGLAAIGLGQFLEPLGGHLAHLMAPSCR